MTLIASKLWLQVQRPVTKDLQTCIKTPLFTSTLKGNQKIVVKIPTKYVSKWTLITWQSIFYVHRKKSHKDTCHQGPWQEMMMGLDIWPQRLTQRGTKSKQKWDKFSSYSTPKWWQIMFFNRYLGGTYWLSFICENFVVIWITFKKFVLIYLDRQYSLITLTIFIWLTHCTLKMALYTQMI